MRSIRDTGIDRALKTAFNQGTPILGICIGLQVSLDHSDEGNVETLGLIPGRVRRFAMRDRSLKVPHMGWNEVVVSQMHPILSDVSAGDEFYFVHSYYPDPTESTNVFATAEYETTFCCAAGFRNFFGTQFHPEKSGRIGLQLLKNFIAWDGRLAQ